MNKREKIKYALALKQQKARRRKARKAKAWLAALTLSLFPEQQAFVQSKADAICAVCTRRAGKTHGSGAKLLFAAHEKSGSTALYLALTRKSAKMLLWPKLKEMASTYNIPLHFNESDLTARLPNGSLIMLYGADQANLGERLRGDAYSICVIDEAASFGPNLEYLIQDVIEPALLDYQGQVVMIGTPGTVLAGPFYDATTRENSGYEVHHWSLLDNPHLPHAKTWIEKLLVRRGWTKETPTYLREYCGIWTEDPDALVYKYNDDNNGVDEIPDFEFDKIIGLDLGYEDPAAWGVIAFSEQTDTAYIIHSERHQHELPEKWAKRTLELQERFSPLETRVDAGALGKPIMLEMQSRWGVPCDATEKSEKMAMIELMNGDFRTGKLKVLRQGNEEYIHQMRTLTKDEKGQKEDPTLPNDLCDACLYAYRNARHYLHREEAKQPKYGTEEWFKKEEARMQWEIEESERQKHERDWLDDLEVA